MVDAALEYAALGWPVCRGAQPNREGPRSCTCDRLGCPAPGVHPISAAWAMEASTDPDTIRRWWSATPEANIILPTGRVFDVLDVPTSAGVMAMAQMDRAGLTLGPVAVLDSERYLFFVATRSPIDEDEWWSCRLDCFPETVEDMPGLRWHCRDSYIPAPPVAAAFRTDRRMDPLPLRTVHPRAPARPDRDAGHPRRRVRPHVV